MAARETLYDSIHQLRQVDRKSIQRIMLTGYFNEEEVKHHSVNIQQFIKDSLKPFSNIKSYIYIKGVFYILLAESINIAHINQYLHSFHSQLNKLPTLLNSVRIVHQSYQNAKFHFRAIDCDNNPQPGPILIDTQKTQEQIQERTYEIYELFMDGAKKKSENPAHKIGTMIVLSNEDMSILISNKFMSLQEYVDLYIGELNVDRDQQFNYPLSPSFFQIMQFLQCQNYETFRTK